jgi:4-diphosphocytidyl-2-C-methyl-D-erythritol kinase
VRLALPTRRGQPLVLSREEHFSLPSYAKINLSLRVLGKRPDGYHELRTIFQTITLADRLTFRALDSKRIELECDAPDVPGDETNLVVRAARLLSERFHVERGAAINLEKSIPAGGGLGGGSSNAAVALVGLARLWNIETGRDELSKLGASLGADVPFFFTGGPALGTGRGTEIAPLADASRASLIVITPRVRISTAEAYKALNAPALTKNFAPVNLLVSREESKFFDSLHASLVNDFESAIFQQQPEIERARNALLDAGARAALLSGSGSSVFGVFENLGEVERARARLRIEDGWRVFVCDTLSRAEYQNSFGECAKFF